MDSLSLDLYTHAVAAEMVPVLSCQNISTQTQPLRVKAKLLVQDCA